MSRSGPDPSALVVWLAHRAELAPESLRPRLADAARGGVSIAGETLGDLSARAGEQLLVKLLAEGCGTRSAAPALLAADAMVTYAFEAVAEDESQGARAIDAMAARAMTRISALGAGE